MIYQAARGARVAAKYMGLAAVWAWVTAEPVSGIHKTLTLNPRVLALTATTRSLTQTLNPRVLTVTTPEE